MKRVFTIFIAFMMLASFCACGDQSVQQETPADTAATTEPQIAQTAPAEAAPAEMTPAAAVEPEAIPVELGGSIDNENFTMTFDSMEMLPEYSYQTSEYSSTSLYVEDGYQILLIRGHMENKSVAAFSDSSFVKTVVVNGTYTVDEYDVRMTFLRDKYFEIDPYTDLDYFLYINVPDKLAAEFETATFTLGFNADMSLPTTVWNADGTTTTNTDYLYSLTSTLGAAPSGAEQAQASETEAPLAEGVAAGDVITTDVWEITLVKAELASAIYPVESGGSGLYYEAGDGYQFVNLQFDIKNLDTDVRSFSDAISNVVIHCDKYDYDGYSMYYDMGGSLSVTMLKGTTHGPSPLDLTHLYVETQIPNEAAGAGAITADLTIAGSQYTITIL